jgi:hypothetical protein
MDVFVQSLNRLCQITTGYLGKAVIVNYWKAARQEVVEQPGIQSRMAEPVRDRAQRPDPLPGISSRNWTNLSKGCYGIGCWLFFTSL